MLIDLHARTKATSRDYPDPTELVEAARRSGLDGVAVVDSQISGHANELIAAGEKADIKVFVGVELETSHGPFLCFAPQVDPFLSREEWRQLTAVPITPTLERVVELFESVGGAIIAVHPFQRRNGVRLGDNLVFCEGIHGVEVVTPKQDRLSCVLALELALKLDLPTTGGSAVGGDIKAVGKAATLFADPVGDQSEFVAALRAGNYWPVLISDGSYKGTRGRSQGDSQDRSRGERRRPSGRGERSGRGRPDRGGGPKRRRSGGR